MIFKGSLVRQDKDSQFIFILFHFSLFVLSPRTVQWLDCPLCYKQLNSKTVKWSIAKFLGLFCPTPTFALCVTTTMQSFAQLERCVKHPHSSTWVQTHDSTCLKELASASNFSIL